MSMTGGLGSPETIIGDPATNHPSVIPVLERLGLDYCCGGRRPIGNAVAEAGLDWPSVAAQIDAALSSSAEAQDSPSWTEASLSELMAHILDCYHAKLREDLPVLTTMGQKVVGAHGERHREVREVLSVLTDLRTELDAHMMKEEHMLFPFIEQIETGLGPHHPMFGHMASPLAVMVHQHIHLENNVLFPRAQQLEIQALAKL